MIEWQERDTNALPSPEFCLISPNEKIPTPMDYRGLINVEQLIQDVKNTVSPEYEWPEKLSVHHLYFPWYNYPYRSDPKLHSPSNFRNLPINKALMPRVFENWLHRITEDPLVPDEEVQEYVTESWSVARDLFKTVRRSVQWERRANRRRKLIENNPWILKESFNGQDLIGEEYMQSIFEKNFREVEIQMHRNALIPEEFRLISLSEDAKTIAKNLGKLVIPGSLDLRSIAA